MATRKIRNTWWVDFRFDRKRYRKRSPDNSRAGAQKYEILLRRKLANGETLDRDDEKEKEQNQSFKDFAWKWFDIYVKSNNKYSEVRGKKYIIESHLVPFFGKSRINQISNLQVEQYKSKKINENLMNKTINNHLAVLSKCLNIAKDWLNLNKLPKIKKLKVAPQKYNFLSCDESKIILENTGGILHEMILLGLKTGLRFGEIKGLRWEDIDWENRTLTVRRSIYRNIVVAPKGNRERKIPLMSTVYELLSEKRKKEGYVFINKKGETLKDNTCRYWMCQAYKKIGIEKIGWHILRHSFASHLAMSGASIKAIQELLGHVDIQTTMRYAHLTPSTLKETVDLLEAEKRNENFGQPAVNRCPNLTRIGQLSAYDKDIFLANSSIKRDLKAPLY